MENVVITGSTRGIGYGLAKAFLELGCAVSISGRSALSVENSINQLSAVYDPQMIYGYPCDVAELEQVRMLWARAQVS